MIVCERSQRRLVDLVLKNYVVAMEFSSFFVHAANFLMQELTMYALNNSSMFKFTAQHALLSMTLQDTIHDSPGRTQCATECTAILQHTLMLTLMLTAIPSARRGEAERR